MHLIGSQLKKLPVTNLISIQSTDKLTMEPVN